MFMKIIRLLLLLIFIFGIFPLVALCEEINQEVYMNIKTPIYSIENINTGIKFIAVNDGNNYFNGSLIYFIKGEGLEWSESKVNLTIQPHNSTTVSIKIKPTYTGHYTIKASINDVNDRQIILKNHPLSVHSFEEAAIIIGTIIAILAIIYRKSNN